MTAGTILSIGVRKFVGGEPHLIILQDKAETSDNRFEGRKNVCRVSHSTKNQFGGSRYSGFPFLSTVAHRVLLVLAAIRVGGVSCPLSGSALQWLGFGPLSRPGEGKSETHIGARCKLMVD